MKEKKLKVYVVGYPSKHQMSWINNAVLEKDPYKADCYVFTGGQDINPELYGEKCGKHMWNGNFDRDKYEIEMWRLAQKLGKYSFGICRGGQLVCCLSGGKLIQHLEHPSSHEIYLNNGNSFRGNSIHHQACYPWNLHNDEYELLGWCLEESRIHLNGDNKEIEFPSYAYTPEGILMEPEILWFPKTKSLMCQGHPEMSSYNSPFVKYLNEKIEELFITEKISEITK